MRHFAKKPQKKFYITNERIVASPLRVIDGNGEQLGVLSKEEAMTQARNLELDLILIAPKANPPVAKIIDYKKFLYQEEKKQKEAKKGVRKGTVKDIKLSLFIAPADLERLMTKAKEFMDHGNQVRLNLTLRGREVIKKELALELVNKFITSLGELNIAKEPRVEGRVIRAIISKRK